MLSNGSVDGGENCDRQNLEFQYSIDTQLVMCRNGEGDHYGATSVPIYQCATFRQDGEFENPYDYTRSGNPSRTAVQDHLKQIMKAESAFALSSGMSALDVILRSVIAGKRQSNSQSQTFGIISGDDLYGGTNRLLRHYEDLIPNLKVWHIDTSDVNFVQQVLDTDGSDICMILLETPTNPMLKIAPIQQISQLAASYGDIKVVVDNTMMSPYLQTPLSLGADVTYHSGTKFLCGHHDVTAGIIGSSCKQLGEYFARTINATGCGLSPFDCFLLLRGVKTLGIRIDRAEENAISLAKFLYYRWGFNVRFPGIRCPIKEFSMESEADPIKLNTESPNEWDVHFSQSSGYGAVLAFILDSQRRQSSSLSNEVNLSSAQLCSLAQKVIQRCKIFQNTVSFGTVNSLISLPCSMSHASIPAHVRKERGLREDLIRLCVGIENIQDLMNDLTQAFKAVGLSEYDPEYQCIPVDQSDQCKVSKYSRKL
ncbi:hypothetical protein MP228_001493 [Amoeboaphelidium protococcarum]|nr:hypothetical protein MP228_001493 [Amoeboaphelidium protococcarum]